MLAGGVPVFWETTVDDGFLPDPEKLEHLITDRTVALVLNSPCNPTGAAYDADLIQRILRIAMRHDLLIISDEIYEKMVYEGFSHFSPAALDPEVKAHTVVVNGVSKEFAMTGWRIGYLAGPKDLVKAMDKIQGQSTSNATSISQKAAEAALRGDGREVALMVAEFDRRRRLIVDGLNAIPGIRCPVPKGAFYAFADFSAHHGKKTPAGKLIEGSAALSEYLLDEAVPGVAFGDDACQRFSYATSTETISQGLARIREALSRLI
jgi:aspartate aminotransferase